MIPLGILTKHRPGGFPRTGPTQSPTEYDFSSYHSPTCICSVCISVHVCRSRSSPVDLPVLVASIYVLALTWDALLLTGVGDRRLATEFVAFWVGTLLYNRDRGCPGGRCALLVGC